MKTLLVPVDFTPTSVNAVDYAAGWAARFGYRRLILLKTFYDTLFDDVVVSADYSHVSSQFRQDEREEANRRLSEIGRNLMLANADLQVEALVSELPLVRAVLDAVRQEGAELVVVGGDTNRYDSDSYVSGHVIGLARTSPVKVLVVPAGHRFEPPRNVLVPVDAFSRASLGQMQLAADPAAWKSLHFNVLTIGPAYAGTEAEQLRNEMEAHLGALAHTYFHSNERNVVDAVIDHLRHYDVQLIVALPGRYSFLYRLTHRRLAEAICRNTERPVMIMK